MVLSAGQPLNFFARVTQAENRTCAIQNSLTDGRPRLGNKAVNIVKNDKGNLTIQVKPPVIGSNLIYQAYLLEDGPAEDTAVGVRYGKLLATSTNGTLNIGTTYGRINVIVYYEDIPIAASAYIARDVDAKSPVDITSEIATKGNDLTWIVWVVLAVVAAAVIAALAVFVSRRSKYQRLATQDRAELMDKIRTDLKI